MGDDLEKQIAPGVGHGDENQIRESSDAHFNAPLNEKAIEATKEPGSGSGSTLSNNDDAANLNKLDSGMVQKPPKAADLDALVAHLPKNEQDIIKEQLYIPEVKVNYFTLFRYATRNDILILLAATFSAIAGGIVLPLFTVRLQFY